MSKNSHAGLGRYGVDAEVWQMLPKVFTDLYEELYVRAVGGALGLKGGVDGKQGGGKPGDRILTRVEVKVDGKRVDPSTLSGKVTELIELEAEGIVVSETNPVPVGKAQRARVTTSETSKDGKVTMGGARGQGAGARGSGKDWITDERALRWKDRIDRALRRVVRDIRKDMDKAELVPAMDVLGERERVCSRVGVIDGWGGPAVRLCGRPAEPNWLYCPHCGAPTREV
jgi:hypothetical protein